MHIPAQDSEDKAAVASLDEIIGHTERLEQATDTTERFKLDLTKAWGDPERRRTIWFPLSLQALHVLPLMLLAQAIQLVIRMLAGADFPGWGQFISPLVATLLWGPLSLLLLAPQYRPVERDENRPI